LNLAHLFARIARRDPDAPAVGLGSRTLWTYRELVDRAARLAAGLTGRLACAPGERVALVMENRPEYLEIELACWWAGCAIVPVNAKLHPKELAWILGHAEPRVCFTSAKLASAVAEAPPPAGCRVVETATTEYARLFETEPLAMAEVGPEALAWLFYTSGTTGRPKGAMITHRNLRAMSYAYHVDVDTVAPRSALLHAAPLSHGSGCYVSPHAAVGSCHVVPESGGFDEAELFELWRAWGRVHLFAAPTMVKRLVRHARAKGLSGEGLATIVYGGAPMYLADLEEAQAVLGFRLAQLYGQGESPMCITALSKREHEAAARAGRSDVLQSAGTAQIVVEVKIADPAGRTLPPGEVGEVLARGDSVVPGYWRDPEASRKTMGDGWLRTGDMGSLDAAGYLTLKDRSKDLIISGGTNIYPREVEEALSTHPRVKEVSVVGLPDPEWGEQVVACVVAEPGTRAEELDAHCLAQIARFKRPKRWVFLEALPKSAYGKILKRELRERLLAADPPSDATR
jgi:long-chain acyl-CoA synthetase